MTPEEAENIDFSARSVEYNKHKDNYEPVIQRQVRMAGYQALIDAVRAETDKEWALKLLSNVAKDSK